MKTTIVIEHEAGDKQPVVSADVDGASIVVRPSARMALCDLSVLQERVGDDNRYLLVSPHYFSEAGV